MKRSVIAFSVGLLMQLIAAPSVAEVKPARVHADTKKPPVVKPKSFTPRQLAEKSSRNKWRSSRQWFCLEKLWAKESHFNPKAHNKRSGAYGIAQFTPQTWGSRRRTSDPQTQIRYGLRYIEKRYGSPCAAWNHHRRYGWY